MIVMVLWGVRSLVRFFAVELGPERTAARLAKVDRQVAFARSHRLIDAEQEPELVEMLIAGATLADAVSELRTLQPSQPALTRRTTRARAAAQHGAALRP